MDPTPLRQYLRVARRQAWLIVLVPLIAITASAIIVTQQTPVYRASMELVVAQSGGDSQPVIGSQALTQTMTNLLESEIVAKTVVDNLGLDLTPRTMLKRIHVSTRPDSSVLKVSYDSTSRTEAVTVLSEIATVFTKLVDESLGISSTSAGFQSNKSKPLIFATVFDPPHLEADQVSPRPLRTIGFAGVLGLALGIALAIARETLDDRIRSKSEAEEAFGAPVIGSLPKGARGKLLLAPNGKVSEPEAINALQLLQARLEFSSDEPSGPRIVVTSAGQEDGKSTVVANLGAVLALAGNNVICIEADFRRPSLHRYFKLGQALPGLTDLIDGKADLETVLQPIPLTDVHTVRDHIGSYTESNGPASSKFSLGGRLRILPMGHPVENPTAFLSGKKVEGVLAQLAAEADYVLLDVPPLVVSDAFPLLMTSNTVLVVARRGRTTRTRAQGVRETLTGLGAERIGVVLTDAQSEEGYGRRYLAELGRVAERT
jgi:receptor protein-tyrosine kinase